MAAMLCGVPFGYRSDVGAGSAELGARNRKDAPRSKLRTPRSKKRAMDPQHPFAVIPGGARDDRDELARLRAEIARRNQQETAIAELGQAALTGVDPMILLGQGC